MKTINDYKKPPHNMSVDDCKKLCADNGWSGFIAGNNTAIFKNTGYDLTPEKMKRNRWNVPFYINLQKKPAEPAFGKWVFIEKMSIYQPGIENLWYHKNRNLSVEDMQRHSEHKGFSGFSMGKIEVNFKRYD